MSRRLKMKRRADKASYDATCKTAALAFSERRFNDALGVYTSYQTDYPESHQDEIAKRINALRSYISEHVENSTFFQKDSIR